MNDTLGNRLDQQVINARNTAQMKATADYVVFVEDPGAANCVAPVVLGLEAQGRAAAVVAVGLAKACLVERRLTRLVRDTAGTASAILDEFQPRILIVGTSDNPDTLGLKLVEEARRRNIVSVGIVDASMNVERRFRGDGQRPFSYVPDWVLVPDEWTRDAFVKAGVPETRTVVCGNAHADHVIDVGRQYAQQDRLAVRRRRVPGAAVGQQIVVFASEGSVRHDPAGRHAHPFDGCTLRPEIPRTGRTEILLEAFVQALRDITPRPYLVLRVHPKDAISDYQAFRDDVDQFDAEPDPLELLFCADLVVGATSMSLQEAAWLGLPTLSLVSFAEQAEWLPTARSGLTPTVTSVEQLRSLLPELLKAPDGPARSAGYGVPQAATERTVEVLNTLIAAPARARAGAGPNPPSAMQLDRCADASEWDRFVATSPHGSVFASTRFLDALDVQYDLLWAHEKGRATVGVIVPRDSSGRVLPAPLDFAMYQGLLFGADYSTLPMHRQSHENVRLVTLVLDGLEPIHDRLSFALHHDFADIRGFSWFHHDAPERGRFAATVRYTGLIDLESLRNLDGYIRSLRKSRRHEYRRALDNGLTVAESDDIDLLLRLYVQTFARQGLQVTPEVSRRLRRLAIAFMADGSGEMLVCRKPSGEPVSASLFIRDERSAYYLVGANDPAYRDTGGGTLLMLENLRRSRDRGVRRVDMCGINSPRRGDFKTSFNARPVPYFIVSWERPQGV